MKTVLFLTYRMMPGFGVDVVVSRISRVLLGLGHRVVIACFESEPGFEGLEIELLPKAATASDVLALAKRVKASVVVAHTSPFFELLPSLQREFPCWAWEHGEPTPSFFEDHVARQERNDNKAGVYPDISGVIAISEFVKQEIGVQRAHIIYNGCDHVPPAESKDQQDIVAGELRPLRIGTLMRLGHGESFYKGNALFQRFAELARVHLPEAEVWVTGRGREEDAKPFRKLGVRVNLNASEDQKCRYLRQLDVFVSFSLWEGFNLPLAEAQAMGTVGLALDTGAHPEVTPFVMSSVEDVLRQVQAYDRDRDLLLRHSRMSWQFARQRFNWERTAVRFAQVVLADGPSGAAGSAR